MNTVHRTLLRALLVALIAVLAVACSPTGAPPTQDEPAAATEAPAEEPATGEEAAAEEPEEADAGAAAPVEITVSHPQGETTLMAPPQRVVVFDYSTLDTLDALGLGDHVAGVMQGPLMPPHLEKYNGGEYTNIGSFFEPDYEAVNALDPDLIIVALRTSPFYEDLSAIAPTIDTTVAWDNSYETLSDYVTNIGLIFGKEAEAQERLAAIEARIGEVQAMAAAADSTALIVLTSGGEVSGYGPGSRFGMIHDLLGVGATADPMAAETHGDAISFEFILEQNPDIIYAIDRDSAVGEEGQTAAQILDNELVNSTTAGATGNIVYLDPVVWYLADAGLTTFATRIEEVAAGLAAAAEAAN